MKKSRTRTKGEKEPYRKEEVSYKGERKRYIHLLKREARHTGCKGKELGREPTGKREEGELRRRKTNLAGILLLSMGGGGGGGLGGTGVPAREKFRCLGSLWLDDVTNGGKKPLNKPSPWKKRVLLFSHGFKRRTV